MKYTVKQPARHEAKPWKEVRVIAERPRSFCDEKRYVIQIGRYTFRGMFGDLRHSYPARFYRETYGGPRSHSLVLVGEATFREIPSDKILILQLRRWV